MVRFYVQSIRHRSVGPAAPFQSLTIRKFLRAMDCAKCPVSLERPIISTGSSQFPSSSGALGGITGQRSTRPGRKEMLCACLFCKPSFGSLCKYMIHIAGLQVKIEMNIPMLLIETPVGMRLIWLQILLSHLVEFARISP